MGLLTSTASVIPNLYFVMGELLAEPSPALNGLAIHSPEVLSQQGWAKEDWVTVWLVPAVLVRKTTLAKRDTN
jgi:hypothetical protein